MKTDTEKLIEARKRNRRLTEQLKRLKIAWNARESFVKRIQADYNDLVLDHDKMRQLQDKLQHFANAVRTRKTVCTCVYPTAEILKHPEIHLLEQRVIVAAQLGYDTLLDYAEATGLSVNMVERTHQNPIAGVQ